eukprot:7637561-Lingulodinium_polyedra.AAC.1
MPPGTLPTHATCGWIAILTVRHAVYCLQVTRPHIALRYTMHAVWQSGKRCTTSGMPTMNDGERYAAYIIRDVVCDWWSGWLLDP